MNSYENEQLIARYAKRKEHLASMKQNYLPIYQELAILGDPRNAYFTVRRNNGDISQVTAKTDDTLQSCLPLHAAVMNSLLTPAAYMWHSMVFPNNEMQEQYGHELAFQNDFIYKKRYSSLSNFTCAMNTIYMSNALYGWYVLELSKDLKHKQVCYRALPIGEFVIDQNERGFVDTFYRTVKFTYRNLRQRFPKYIPKKVREQTYQDNPYAWLDESMELLHVVEPSIKKAGKFDSVYIDMTSREIIQQTEESYCKYIAGRAATFSNTNDPYGFSPVMSILPSVKNLNAVAFDLIKATHHASRLDLLAGDDILNPRNYQDVTSIINGGMDSEGRPQVSVLAQRDMPTLEYMVQGWQKKIKDTLFVDMFMSLQDTQSRSATDAMLKANERANIVAPMGDRVARELLQPMIELELAMYAEMGALPAFSKELKGESFDIILDNPMLRGQRLDSANALLNMGNTLAQLQPLDSEINIDRAKNYLASAYNIPQTVLNTDNEKAQIVAAKQQQAEQQMIMENAGNIGSGIKNISDAGINMEAASKAQ
ncbi:MAG: hypothetical protein II453_02875 [Alphaproteobacteria bacterium]|nr:hypothetical protein [Alphaproteobacteria bacterium]